MSDPQTLVIQVEPPELPQNPEPLEACPPHEFLTAWATPASGEGENVPCIVCCACGEIRALCIPSDVIPEE